MPPYAFLANGKIDFNKTTFKLAAMKTVGVPYTTQQIDGAASDAQKQAAHIAKDLADNGAQAAADSELVALIAYLQRIGKKATDPSKLPAGGLPVSQAEAR